MFIIRYSFPSFSHFTLHIYILFRLYSHSRAQHKHPFKHQNSFYGWHLKLPETRRHIYFHSEIRAVSLRAEFGGNLHRDENKLCQENRFQKTKSNAVLHFPSFGVNQCTVFVKKYNKKLSKPIFLIDQTHWI